MHALVGGSLPDHHAGRSTPAKRRSGTPSEIPTTGLAGGHTRSKAFAQQAHRESVSVRNSAHADEDQACVDAISAWDSE